MSEEIVTERHRLADMILEMAMEQPVGCVRMVLAIVSKDVRRGRRLTASEKITNLQKAMNDWESEKGLQLSDFGGAPR